MKTKRYLTQIWLLGAAFLALPASVQAQFTFTTNNGAITITGDTNIPVSGVVIIPGSINGYPVTGIGTNSFAFSSLTSMTIGTNVTSIAGGAFFSCSDLTNVTIPNSVTNIGNGSFAGCGSLIAIAVSPGNPAYSSVSGVLFNESQTTLIAYPGGDGDYNIPDGVTNIGSEAFGYDNLFSVSFPQSVAGIGDYAFGNCNIYELFFEGNAPSGDNTDFTNDSNCTIYYSAGTTGWGPTFEGRPTELWMPFSCTTNNGTIAITGYNGPIGAITIPGTINGLPVTSIAAYAFNTYTGLTSVTIPASVTNIGPDAFFYCDSLTNVFFEGNAPSVDPTAFEGFTANDPATAYYLPGTTGWSNFLSIAGLPGALWNPRAQTSGPGFGVRTNRFGFNITGTTNIPIVVEASTNLAGVVWKPLLAGPLTNGSIYFSDPSWTNYPRRFYRISSP